MVGNGLFRPGESSWISFGPSCWFSGRFWRFLIFWIFGFLWFKVFLKKWIFGGRYGFREAFQEIQNEISLPGTSRRPQNQYYRAFLWRKRWDDDDDTTRHDTTRHDNTETPEPSQPPSSSHSGMKYLVRKSPHFDYTIVYERSMPPNPWLRGLIKQFKDGVS